MESEIRKRLADAVMKAGADIPDAGVLELSVPPDPAHGDLSSNAALIYAKTAGREPRRLAEDLAAAIRAASGVARAEIAGPGFVNIFLKDEVIFGALKETLREGNAFGRSDIGKGRKAQVEFVSANPTGPLNAVNARATAFGDALARLLEFTGYDVQREYYVCDCGTQIELLGASVRERLKEKLTGEAARIPDEGYRGAYVIPLAETLREQGKIEPEDADDVIGRAAAAEILAWQAEDLARFNTGEINWTNEFDLYSRGKVDAAEEKLRAAGLTYDKDGARWLRTTAAGDDEDRVLIRADGRATYFMADIAYHLDKAARGFDQVVDVLGPDHHGHVKKMVAAMALLGLPPGWLEIIIVQQVNLVEGGAKVKMSKRAGAMVTMREVMEDIGVDAARFFFLMRAASSHLDFDLELARKQSMENPVYYAQYCHARVENIKREAGAAAGAPPGDAAWAALDMPEERVLARKVWEFPRVVEAAAARREPHKITAYATELASLFHAYYQRHRILQAPTAAQAAARLVLARAVGHTVKNALALLGVGAPAAM